jgi:hypothetical protein
MRYTLILILVLSGFFASCKADRAADRAEEKSDEQKFMDRCMRKTTKKRCCEELGKQMDKYYYEKGCGCECVLQIKKIMGVVGCSYDDKC